jgi:integrase
MEYITEKKILPNQLLYKVYRGKKNEELSSRWYVNYSFDYKGIRLHKKIYGDINRFNTIEERDIAAQKLIESLESGEFFNRPKGNPLERAIQSYWMHWRRSLRYKSETTYQTKLEAFLKYCKQNEMTDIKKVDTEFARQFLMSIDKSNTTINSYRDCLRTIFEFFLQDNLIKKNPFTLIKKLPEARQSKMFFNKFQIEQLKKYISSENETLWMAVQLLFYCFIRPGEIRMLKLEHFNLEEGFIQIPASISKNKKTQTVCIPEHFKIEIEKWINVNMRQDDYFLTRSNKTIFRDYLNKEHCKILRELGYGKRYSFYSWKHTGAVALVKAGAHIKDIQLQLRHHSLDMVDEYLKDLGVLQSDFLRNKYPII